MSEGLVSSGQGREKHLHRQRPRHARLGTHHLLQLVLDLPVHLCHLEEHVPCRDKTQEGFEALSSGDIPGLGQAAPCWQGGIPSQTQGASGVPPVPTLGELQ